MSQIGSCTDLPWQNKFDLIPDEVVLKIFQYLQSEVGDGTKLLDCRLVCQRFNRLARDPSLLRNMTVDVSMDDKKWATFYQQLKWRAPHLHSINLTYSGFTFKLFQYCQLILDEIGQMSLDLNTMTIKMCTFGDLPPMDLRNLKSLKKLTLEECELVQNYNLLQFPSNLESLYFCAVPEVFSEFEPLSMKAFEECTNLEILSLERLHCNNKEETEDFFRTVGCNLKVLKISELEFFFDENEGIRTIADNCPFLEIFHLTNTTFFYNEDEDFDDLNFGGNIGYLLSKCKNLKKIKLSPTESWNICDPNDESLLKEEEIENLQVKFPGLEFDFDRNIDTLHITMPSR